MLDLKYFKTPIGLLSLALALAFIYVMFGLLKVIGKSPVEELVVTMFVPMQNSFLFILLGISEVVLGIGLLVPRTRKLACLLILLHLASIFGLSLLNPGVIFTGSTVVTFAGEFIAKNFVLAAAAWVIYRS